MGSNRVTLEEKERYIQYRQMGAGIREAARRVGRSERWAHGFEVSGQIPQELKVKFPGVKGAHRKAELIQRPAKREQLCPEALRSLDDFEFFRRRYFGHVSTPWQVEAGYEVRERLESTEDEFVVLNEPPGSGKTTLFTCDIPSWLLVRNRAIRELLGHRVQARANEYSGRIRSALTRRVPFKADPRMVALGLAVDAEATLPGDFGPFKPTQGDELWRRDQFTVIQDDELRTDEKESTVVAFGSDSGQLGYRADYIVWDDLFSKKIRTDESVTAQRDWFDDEAETRLEPGGVFLLVAQRLAAYDISRYCLDKRYALDDFEVVDLDAKNSGRRVYHHIVYPAHVESACEGNHSPDAPAYPGHRGEPNGGCLLDPRRLSWRKLTKVMEDDRKFRVVYQQEDTDPASVLVKKLWVDGGVDADGEQFVGCWDDDRKAGQLPQGLERPLLSVATADPSPKRFWSVQWWVVQPSTGLRFLMANKRQAMSASEFLDWDAREDIFTGVMEEWFWWSAEVGIPITHWIVEANAAQSFMFQYQHFHRWMQARGVRVIRHLTARNKADEELGLEATLPPIYRRGLVRLPGYRGDNESRPASLKLVDEVTRLPDGATTDDCAMAQWFLEFNLPSLIAPDRAKTPTPKRPGFLRRRNGMRTAA